MVQVLELSTLALRTPTLCLFEINISPFMRLISVPAEAEVVGFDSNALFELHQIGPVGVETILPRVVVLGKQLLEFLV